MPAVRFCFVLLLSVCFVLRVSCAKNCINSKDKSDVRMCAVRELLWGWLNVTNKTAVRAGKVMQNATALRDRANTVETKAKESLKMANNVMGRLKNSDSEQVAMVEKAVKVLKNVFYEVNTSRSKAVNAENKANTSMNAAVSGYGVIFRAANSILGKQDDALISYEKALGEINKIQIAKEAVCPEDVLVSKNLSAVADKLDVTKNLSEWKNEMLRLLNSTYDKITQNESTCHFTFSDAVKFKCVEDAVDGAVKELEVSLEEFNKANLALKEAEKNVTNAAREVEVVNATMLGRFKKNGEALCGMIKRRAGLSMQLDATVEHLKSAKKQTADKVSDTAHLLANITETNEVVQSVTDAISQLLKSESLPSAAKLFASGDISSANENAKRFKNVATLSAQSVTRAKKSTTELEDQTENNKKEFKHIREQLIARLNETKLNISDLTADECNKKFSEISVGSWEDAFDRALGINETALWETNKTLKQLEAQIELMGSNLTKINSSVRDINEAMSNAEQIREAAKAAAANAFADVLRSLMQEMCSSATELHELQKKNNGLKGTAKALKNNVSVESRRAEAAWKRDNDLSGMPPDVEEGFTYASRGVAVLEKHLQRIDAQYTNVINVVSQELEITEESGAKTYDVAVNFVRDINSNLADFSSPSVCDGGRVAELVQTVMKSREAMLKNVSAIVSLGELAAKVRERVTAARDQMRKAVSSAADAQAAVEEAIRRARDADAGRRCTPLHRQLLNVLRHIW
ncbi:hypothetical protein ERJ75_000184700 [Trypanosoma vivax]|uniref:Uncharacterized protein n=1 Tax=Trypanosoma vivax (strain Y486) TaxID=1055687 RepID=F9WKW9_TRYVY|nr:hypothetical protein ERJ75_000184700 [Trypanosoma vivax]CCD18151.1 hypothetical protein, conserved in T. vivax [Trypanosoma vivax Y486]|eukprot:CCD18151.1 hypothetical protein, conserved in T. vivax [Trypanosoma vivax Y486]